LVPFGSIDERAMKYGFLPKRKKTILRRYIALVVLALYLLFGFLLAKLKSSTNKKSLLEFIFKWPFYLFTGKKSV